MYSVKQKYKKVNEFLMKKKSPVDYFLFPKLKIPMKGAFFDYFPAIKTAVAQVLSNIPLDDMKEFLSCLSF